MSRIEIVPPGPGDRAAWQELFEGYRHFYKMPEDPPGKPGVADTVWRWLNDPAHPTGCLLARTAQGEIVGLAHFRDLPRPLSGTLAGFLDDLFVAEGARGSGVADALVAAVTAEGRKRGWSWLRWFTAEDNHRARGFYDRVARLTPWQTYQIDI